MGLLDSSSSPQYNTSGLINQADQSAQTQGQNLALQLQKLQALNDPYKQAIAGQVQGAQQQTADLGNKYIGDVSNASNALGSSLSDSLSQRIMQANQGNTQALREQLAATGGLQRGGADAAFIGNAANVANQIGQGNQGIIQQQLAARLAATGDVYNANQGMVGTGLGLNTGVTNSIYGANRGDTAGYYGGLNDIEANRNSNVLGAMSTQANANFAGQAAAQQQQGALLGAGLGAAGTVVGGMYGGPVGAAVGAKAGKAIADSSLGRGTTQNVA